MRIILNSWEDISKTTNIDTPAATEATSVCKARAVLQQSRPTTRCQGQLIRRSVQGPPKRKLRRLISLFRPTRLIYSLVCDLMAFWGTLRHSVIKIRLDMKDPKLGKTRPGMEIRCPTSKSYQACAPLVIQWTHRQATILIWALVRAHTWWPSKWPP